MCLGQIFKGARFQQARQKYFKRMLEKSKPNLVFSFWSAGLQEQKARRRTIRRFFIPILMPEIQATITIEADADKNIF